MNKTQMVLCTTLLLVGCSEETSTTPNEKNLVSAEPSILPDYVIDTISSMTEHNDAPLLNAPAGASWAEKGIVVQGIPRGDSAPSWWVSEIVDESIKNREYWDALTAWFTVFESTENQAQDVTVFYDNFEIWLLKGERIENASWSKLSSANTAWVIPPKNKRMKK